MRLRTWICTRIRKLKGFRLELGFHWGGLHHVVYNHTLDLRWRGCTCSIINSMKFGIPSHARLNNITFKCSLYYSKSKFRLKNPTASRSPILQIIVKITCPLLDLERKSLNLPSNAHVIIFCLHKPFSYSFVLYHKELLT